MKHLLVIPIHSTIDLITNSSTEIFVSSINKSIDVIRDILSQEWEKWKENNEMDGVYGNLDSILTVSMEDTKGLYNDTMKHWDSGFAKKYKNYAKVLVVQGIEDNSIPYEFFDTIEDVLGLNSNRYHLG